MGRKRIETTHEEAPTSNTADADVAQEATSQMAPPQADVTAAIARWKERRPTIDAAERALETLREEQRADENIIGAAVAEKAKAAKQEPVITIGQYRVKAKRRPDDQGGGYRLQDAPIAESITL